MSNWEVLPPCVLGVATLGLNVYRRLGRTERARAWAEDEGFSSFVGTGAEQTLVFGPVAGFGFAIMGLGLIPSPGLQTAVAFVSVICIFVALAFRHLPLPYPRWTMPRWFREGGYPVLRTRDLKKAEKERARRQRERRKKAKSRA